MPSTLTTLDSLLKNVYLPGLPNFVNTKRPIFGRIEKITKKERFKGRKLIFAAKDANPQGVGVIGESEILPTSGNTEVVNMELTMKYYYGVARLTAQVMDGADGDAGSFADSVKTELNGVRDQLEEDMAIHALYGDGYGALAEVASYASTTLTLKNQTTVGQNGTRNLRKNMTVSSYTAKSGGAISASHRAISAITGSSTATVPAAAGFLANDFVFRNVTAGVDPRDKAMMGLGGIVDDGTRRATFQGLSRTTYPSLKANVLGNSGTLRAWSSDLMDELAMESSQNGGGAAPTAFYSVLQIQRRAAAFLRNDRQYDMSVKTLDGGYKAVEWTSPAGTVPWFEDKYCLPNEVMAVHEPDLFLAIQQELGAVNGDGKLWRYTDRSDVLEYWMRTWRNLGSRACNNHTTLKDISHTA